MQGLDLEINLKIPDLWQQDAIRALSEGKDVVVNAPTGSGKTYIFELYVSSHFRGKAIYTVPTRALANDKLLEWRDERWNVGIATGDIAENLDAPIIVATLETQKQKLLCGEGPDLLVIDEYQMLGDESRGVNYEIAMAMAPPDTQLLLLSGSVQNPEHVTEWLRRLGRDVVLVNHKERPVPQEEIFVEALPQRIPNHVHGFWPRLVTKALMADMGPILLFAPQRKSAEHLARKISAALPIDEPLILTPEQKRLAGDDLTRLLKNRIAFHHSGLSYQQRAGLVEPLAKTGQLRVVVATTGLGAGVNFSMRSVMVTDREYRMSDHHSIIRPDELLQMFGRAGRRGLDKMGYILVAPDKPRLSEARPIRLKRNAQLEWPGLLGVMHAAAQAGMSPYEAAVRLTSRLFSEQRVSLGLKAFIESKQPTQPESHRTELIPLPKAGDERYRVIEMLNSRSKWERRKAPVKTKLKEVVVRENDSWVKALSSVRTMENIGIGNLCKIGKGNHARYGREIQIAVFPTKAGSDELMLTRNIYREYATFLQEEQTDTNLFRRGWSLEKIEKEIIPLLPALTNGGKMIEITERGGILFARLDYSEKEVFAHVDTEGVPLLAPPEREVDPSSMPQLSDLLGHSQRGRPLTHAQTWFQLGLIDNKGYPTRRGIIFSFFNHGEGLAIAAGLEDKSYPIEELVYHLANLRAGFRFAEYESSSGRLGAVCRMAYGSVDFPGYLRDGVPTDYGEGAAEILQELHANPSHQSTLENADLGTGDIERMKLEWRSLLNHIEHAPDYDWDRYRELKTKVTEVIDSYGRKQNVLEFPPLTYAQKQRYKSPLRFR